MKRILLTAALLFFMAGCVIAKHGDTWYGSLLQNRKLMVGWEDGATSKTLLLKSESNSAPAAGLAKDLSALANKYAD